VTVSSQPSHPEPGIWMIGSAPFRLAIGLRDWNPLKKAWCDTIRGSAPKDDSHTWPRYGAMMDGIMPSFAAAADSHKSDSATISRLLDGLTERSTLRDNGRYVA
jgi:hypothetical protein